MKEKSIQMRRISVNTYIIGDEVLDGIDVICDNELRWASSDSLRLSLENIKKIVAIVRKIGRYP